MPRERPPTQHAARSRSSFPSHSPRLTSLVLSPLAYLELQFHCQHADTEIAAMAISSEHDPLYVERIQVLKQTASPCFVEMDDAAVADHIENCAELGIPPARCGRIWMHTHPADSADPSITDEQTFSRAFGGCDWSVMFILARGGETYARLQFSALPGVQVKLPVTVDWSEWPTVARTLVAPEHVGHWHERHAQCVHPDPTQSALGMMFDYDGLDESEWRSMTDEVETEYTMVQEMQDQQAIEGGYDV